jgi:hypothetical protein
VSARGSSGAWKLPWIAVVLSVSACGQPGARPATVPLRLSGGPGNASVTVDDEPIGSFDSVAAHGVALPPGTHRLTVEADGYFPSDRVIDAELGGPVVRLNVQLEKIPR